MHGIPSRQRGRTTSPPSVSAILRIHVKSASFPFTTLGGKSRPERNQDISGCFVVLPRTRRRNVGRSREGAGPRPSRTRAGRLPGVRESARRKNGDSGRSRPPGPTDGPGSGDSRVRGPAMPSFVVAVRGRFRRRAPPSRAFTAAGIAQHPFHRATRVAAWSTFVPENRTVRRGTLCVRRGVARVRARPRGHGGRPPRTGARSGGRPRSRGARPRPPGRPPPGRPHAPPRRAPRARP